MAFRDRRDAGRQLAALLGDYGCDEPLVLGLARGGVVVGCEVARALDAPLASFERRDASVGGRTVILVCDGVCTGHGVRAAIASLRVLAPRRIVLATPVGDFEAIDALAVEVDEVVCLEAPAELFAVGLWYADFDSVGDDEASALLALSAKDCAAPAQPTQ